MLPRTRWAVRYRDVKIGMSISSTNAHQMQDWQISWGGGTESSSGNTSRGARSSDKGVLIHWHTPQDHHKKTRAKKRATAGPGVGTVANCHLEFKNQHSQITERPQWLRVRQGIIVIYSSAPVKESKVLLYYWDYPSLSLRLPQKKVLCLSLWENSYMYYVILHLDLCTLYNICRIIFKQLT